jgi:hypothetical protein
MGPLLGGGGARPPDCMAGLGGGGVRVPGWAEGYGGGAGGASCARATVDAREERRTMLAATGSREGDRRMAG